MKPRSLKRTMEFSSFIRQYRAKVNSQMPQGIIRLLLIICQVLTTDFGIENSKNMERGFNTLSRSTRRCLLVKTMLCQLLLKLTWHQVDPKETNHKISQDIKMYKEPQYLHIRSLLSIKRTIAKTITRDKAYRHQAVEKQLTSMKTQKGENL